MEKSEMKKMKYEKPVVLDLGEMARGSALVCDNTGGTATGAPGYCNDGGANFGHCISGSNVFSGCSATGETPTRTCSNTGGAPTS